MFFWYFLITLKNTDTLQEKTIENETYSGNADYFTAWKNAVDAAKKAIDAEPDPFKWYVVSIADNMRR